VQACACRIDTLGDKNGTGNALQADDAAAEIQIRGQTRRVHSQFRHAVSERHERLKRLVLVFCLLVAGCTTAGVVITDAPVSLGNCMPQKPGGGCP